MNPKCTLMIVDNYNINLVFDIRYGFKTLLILTVIKLEDMNKSKQLCTYVKKKINLYLIIILNHLVIFYLI